MLINVMIGLGFLIAILVTLYYVLHLAQAGNIWIVAKSGEVPKVKVLLRDRPGLVNSRDKDGKTPLHYAAEGGHLEIVDILITRGANVKTECNVGMTPLHLAVMNAHREVSLLLINRGANINARSKFGLTPLKVARTSNKPHMVEILKEYGAKE
ncbi:MAG: ankyrin repeat domain-containing protein [Candidatus Eremiobacteraeota bacterium]|nr:ankyrin repeat domain-containing protein [Candidatus Eremiobacteraeota bacterium]